MNRDKFLVQITALDKSFGDYVALKGVNLEIMPGDFVAILGPSGCGKTTLLRLLGGFLQPDKGTIVVDGKDVTASPPQVRPINTVFQGYGLFPHMSVRQNVAYGLKISGVSAAEIATRVDAVLALVKMSDFVDRNVRALSGGQQQRVALARALVMRPKVLLLDESLGALDLKLRQQLQSELRSIHREIGGTFVIVTHDQTEAFALANKVAVMNKGRIEQFASPEEIYHKPATEFVASFVGEGNFLHCRRHENAIVIDAANTIASPGPNGDVVVLVRPEDIRVSPRPWAMNPNAPRVSLPAVVRERSFQGASSRLEMVDEAGRALSALVNEEQQPNPINPGQTVHLSWDGVKQIIFN